MSWVEKNRKINNLGGGGDRGAREGEPLFGTREKVKKAIALHHGDSNFLFYFDICNQIHTFNDNLKGEDLT